MSCAQMKFLVSVEQWLTREYGIDLKFCAKDVLFGVVEKDNFINSGNMLCEIIHHEM